MQNSYDRPTNTPDIRINVEGTDDFAARDSDFSSDSLSESGEPARTAEDDRQTSSRTVLEATARLRGEYARLQQTINQNQDAQSLWSLLTAVIPFFFVFALKVLFDNFLSIFRLLIALVGFVIVDSRVQHLFAAVHPPTSARVASVIIFAVLLYLTSVLHIYEYGFDMKNALLLQYAGDDYHGFYFTLYVLIITDTFIKMVVSGAKMLVSFFGISMGMKRRICQLLEYVSQMYRCTIPAPQWMHYFSGVDSSEFSFCTSGVLISIYAFVKARELWGLSLVTVDCASRICCPTAYGVSPSSEEIGMQGMCSICHGGFSSPTKLSCSHIFCTNCIETWLECENTCPMCRAIVEKKNNMWKNGATSKMIRLC